MELPQDSAFGFMPQTNAGANFARQRGWWVSEVEHMPNGMVKVVYSFTRRPNQVTYLTPANWNALSVANVGRMYAGQGVSSELPPSQDNV